MASPELLALAANLPALEAEKLRRSRNKISGYYPEAGPLRRGLYPQHLEFFRCTREHNESAIIAGNRCGKTLAGAYATTCHLTGQYPDWWPGKRFPGPIRAWAVGNTGETTRDVLQYELLGDHVAIGSGMIPGDLIVSTSPKPGLPNAVGSVWVRHAAGGTSLLQFKAYDQGREKFQGTAQHWVWLDEECPLDVYTECLARTMTTDGNVALTFTPLKGLSPLVLEFMPGGQIPESQVAC